MDYGFVKVAAATPEIKVADCVYNTESVLKLWLQAEEQGCQLVVFPELVLTGATCGDLFTHPVLLNGCMNGLKKLIDASADKVQSGSQQVHAAGRTMEDIVAQVKNVTQLIAQISHSTLEQADGLSSLTRAVDELNLITQKNAELGEESAQVSAMVKHRASRLEDAVTVLH